ncbi:MAG: zf-TFIIB domain-containing protein [Candidatus Omnitrophota bacterium]
MKCPVCSMEMVEKDLGGVKIDVCAEGCKGMWFDWMELARLDENNEGFGETLREALNYSRVNDEARQAINCPKCGVPMHMHKYQSSKEVNVDECYACGGFFLDSGELKAMRESFMSEEEREAYTDKMIGDIPEYKETQEELERQQSRNAAIDRFTRYLRISYYVG